LLRNPKIRQAIDAEIARQSERTGMQSDAILHHLGQIAFSDIGGAFDDNGTLLPLHEMPESMQLTIADMDIRETGEKCVSKRIRLSDKNRALELLGKHLGLFAERSK